jgi:hypothetical protein
VLRQPSVSTRKHMAHLHNNMCWLESYAGNQQLYYRCAAMRRGTLPGSLSSIRTLRWLLLGSNQLTGNLPDPLGQLPGMLMAALDDNNFTGPIPDSWCGSTAQFRVEGNPLLCGKPSSSTHAAVSWQCTPAVTPPTCSPWQVLTTFPPPLQVLCRAPTSSGHWMGPTCSDGARREWVGAAAPPRPTATSMWDAGTSITHDSQPASSNFMPSCLFRHASKCSMLQHLGANVGHSCCAVVGTGSWRHASGRPAPPSPSTSLRPLTQ